MRTGGRTATAICLRFTVPARQDSRPGGHRGSHQNWQPQFKYFVDFTVSRDLRSPHDSDNTARIVSNHILTEFILRDQEFVQLCRQSCPSRYLFMLNRSPTARTVFVSGNRCSVGRVAIILSILNNFRLVAHLTSNLLKKTIVFPNTETAVRRDPNPRRAAQFSPLNWFLSTGHKHFNSNYFHCDPRRRLHS